VGRGFCRLEFWPINMHFKTSKGLLVHLREFPIQRSCVHFLVRLVPNSNRHLSRNTSKGMSSSDSVSLSMSSSESVESGRSRGR